MGRLADGPGHLVSDGLQQAAFVLLGFGLMLHSSLTSFPLVLNLRLS